jgi:hypothetical protein
MNIELPEDYANDQVEKLMRKAAPSLPEALRTRTLALCATQREIQQRHRQRTARIWMWSLAGWFALQWLVAGLVDSASWSLVYKSTRPASGNVQAQPAPRHGAED